MKECERISSFYGKLHDEELSSQLQNEMLGHFQTCTACREDYKWYRITVQALNNFEEVSPPKDFVAQLSARLYATQSPRFYESYLDYIKNFFSSPPYLPLPVGVATLVFLVAVGVVVYNHAPMNHMQQSMSAHAGNSVGVRRPDAVVAVNDTPGMPSPYHLATPNAAVPQPSFPSSSVPSRFQTAAIPKSISPAVGYPENCTATLADRIGGDNLTVESPSVDLAVESIKKILPDIRGTLVKEMTLDRYGEKVLGVRIPSSSYGSLTTELINHGSVAAGSGPDAKTPAPSRTGSNNLILYIRFVQSH